MASKSDFKKMLIKIDQACSNVCHRNTCGIFKCRKKENDEEVIVPQFTYFEQLELAFKLNLFSNKKLYQIYWIFSIILAPNAYMHLPTDETGFPNGNWVVCEGSGFILIKISFYSKIHFYKNIKTALFYPSNWRRIVKYE